MAGRDGRLDEGGSVAQLSDRHELRATACWEKMTGAALCSVAAMKKKSADEETQWLLGNGGGDGGRLDDGAVAWLRNKA
jgi:hypothetical protein